MESDPFIFHKVIHIVHECTDVNKLNSAEMRMLRWSRGKTRLDHIRNEDTRKDAHIKPVETVQENKRLKLFGHCLRREDSHICAKSLRLEVSGRSRGRPKKRWRVNIKRWRDNIQVDVKKYRLTEDMAQDRKYWMTKIMVGPAQGDVQERCDKNTYSALPGDWQVSPSVSLSSRPSVGVCTPSDERAWSGQCIWLCQEKTCLLQVKCHRGIRAWRNGKHHSK